MLLGIIGAARVVPYIVLSVPAGIVADRFDRRLVLMTTDIARGIIQLLMAAAVILNMSVWVVVVLAIAATCFSAFFSPECERLKLPQKTTSSATVTFACM